MTKVIPDNSNFKGANRFHNSVVGRVEHNSAHVVVLLLFSLQSFSLHGLFSSLLGLSLSGQSLGHSLLGILLTGEFAGGLSSVVSTGLGALGHNLLASLGLKINQADVGVLQTDSLHGVDVFTTVSLELSKGGVHILKILELAELLAGAGLDVTLLRLDNDTTLGTVLLVEVFVEEHTTVSNEGGVDGHGEEKEGQDTLPGFNNTIRDGTWNKNINVITRISSITGFL